MINAQGGNDTVVARRGNDTVCGGNGKDTIGGGAGRDRMIGERRRRPAARRQGQGHHQRRHGHDTMIGGPKDDSLHRRRRQGHRPQLLSCRLPRGGTPAQERAASDVARHRLRDSLTVAGELLLAGAADESARPRGPITDEPQRSTLAIEATGLVKAFGDTQAVDGVDLAVRRGSVYGVLGPNGAGKTTTIRMLATLLRPDAGSARVLGHDIVREADEVRAGGQPHRPARLGRRGPDRAREPDPDRAPAGPEARSGQGARDGAAGGVRPRGGRRQAGQELLRRHAAPARHRGQHRRHPGADVPRRADDRPRPPLAQPGLGHHPRRWSPRGRRSCSAPSTSTRPTSSPTGSR